MHNNRQQNRNILIIIRRTNSVIREWTFSVIPDEGKLNGENQEIDFKEHNDEPNNEHTQEITEANCVTS